MPLHLSEGGGPPGLLRGEGRGGVLRAGGQPGTGQGAALRVQQLGRVLQGEAPDGEPAGCGGGGADTEEVRMEVPG